jgi:RNA polymerase sigma-70 factor (ECF subfamily)
VVVSQRWGSPGSLAHPTPDNAQLVAAHLAGDARAFQELVVRYRGRLLNFVNRMIGDRERAEDLVQEAFMRVHRHLHRFDPSKKFSTWIYTIASNLAKNELRNRSRSPLVFYESLRPQGEEDQRPFQFEDPRSRPDDMYANRYLREMVDATVATLSPPHRAVFVMRELEGRSYEEIARLTHCNLGTVKSRLNRARHAFAERIAPYLD